MLRAWHLDRNAIIRAWASRELQLSLTSEDVAKVKESYTGKYLKDLLARRPAKSATPKKSAAE